MKEKVTSYYKGDFTYENPELVFSDTELEFSVCAGNLYKGYFTISGEGDNRVKGILSTSSPFIKLNTKEFSSKKSRIEFTFDASGLEPTTTLDEKIFVISDCGEYFVKLHAHIVRPYFNSKIGKVMDLTRFTYLARYNWQQAVDIFTSNDFSSYILSNDYEYAYIRKQLLKSRSMNQALEEFLIAVNQKLPIKLSISKSELAYNINNESIADKILITLENWGYINVDIDIDCPFIHIDDKSISSESFIGNGYFLEFILMPEKMHKGKNYGRIYLKTTYETLIIEIKVKVNEDDRDRTERQEALNIQSQKVNLAKLYLDYRQKNITKAQYIESGREIAEDIKMSANKISDKIRSEYMDLFLIQLSILNDEEEQGKKDLDKKELPSKKWRRTNPDLYWAFMLVKALYSSKTDSQQVINQIEKHYYGKGRNNLPIFLALIYLSPQDQDDKKILREINNHFLHGSRSPYLYYETLKIYNKNPRYLSSLGKFQIQIINFAIKINHLSEDLAIQFVYLASKEKNYNELVFRVLTKIYKKYESLEVLNSICSLLIKGNKRGYKYFKWYKQGVLANLRIAELYEYFMHSLDQEEQEKLPQNLLYYFTYSNTLNVQKRSYLYAYLIKHKNEVSEVYKLNLNKIKEFAYDQVEAGIINSDLAIIYKEVFFNNNHLMDQRKLLWNVVFRYKIECENPNIKGLIIAHKELSKETYIPLNKGQAEIDIYNDDVNIFFVDNKDNIYYKDIEYAKDHLIDIEKNVIDDLPENDENKAYLLYETRNALNNKKYDKDVLRKIERILSTSELSQDFYTKIILSLIFYYDKINSNTVDKYLEILDHIPNKLKDKHIIIELLIDRKFYNKAFEEISRYGYDKIDLERLYKLSTTIVRKKYEDKSLFEDKDIYEDTLLSQSYYCFNQDKHNIYILNYIIGSYQGRCKDLYKIWQVARSYNIDTQGLEEKFLTQVIFTDNKELDTYSVFKHFTQNGIDTFLAKAFLNYKAFEYLIKEVEIEKGFFNSMESLVKTEKNDYCILCLLKYYSSLDKLDESKLKFAHRFLEEYIEKGIVLPFFKDFAAYISLPYSFIYKTFAEIRTNPNNKVTITYKYICKEDCSESYGKDEYTREVLKHKIGGIFTKSFLIFYNDEVRYSITVETPQGHIRKTEEKILKIGQDMEINEDNLYNQINLLKLSKDAKDDETFIDCYKKINKMDYVINRAFKPLE